MKTALYFEKLDGCKVKCTLCPHGCVLKPGQTGICRVRTNSEGVLLSENYGKVSSIHLDPMEKKPLYHFYPGSKILSIGSVGCNLQCNFCQNCEISQTGVSDFQWVKDYAPKEIVAMAVDMPGNVGIAFTYNEPVVYYEFMLDIAKLSKSKGLQNVMVSNGFINEKPLAEILPWIDAFNIDLKSFSDIFYRNQTHSQIEPIKHCLKMISNAGKHLEVTNLVIPGLNDNERDFANMIDWICTELGAKTVLHISRYFPRYKSLEPATPRSTIDTLQKIAQEKLSFVYPGNL